MKRSEVIKMLTIELDSQLDIRSDDPWIEVNEVVDLLLTRLEELGMLPPLTKVYKPQPVLDECGSHYIVEEKHVWEKE